MWYYKWKKNPQSVIPEKDFNTILVRTLLKGQKLNSEGVGLCNCKVQKWDWHQAGLDSRALMTSHLPGVFLLHLFSFKLLSSAFLSNSFSERLFPCCSKDGQQPLRAAVPLAWQTDTDKKPPSSMSRSPWTESSWPGWSTSCACLWISCVSGDKVLWVVRPEVGSRLRFITFTAFTLLRGRERLFPKGKLEGCCRRMGNDC